MPLSWIFGVAIMFGLTFVMSYLTDESLNTFFIWLCIFNGFIIWGGLLPLWTFFLSIIALTITTYLQITTNKNGG